MAEYVWPVCMLEEYKIPADTLTFFDSYARESDRKHQALSDLYKEHELLKSTSAKQDRYITELEKQLSLLQKTLDLVERNTKGVLEDG